MPRNDMLVVFWDVTTCGRIIYTRLHGVTSYKAAIYIMTVVII
jgi:hypothetical protein